ncbi:VWA domain-containing protein [Labrys wisconsinensis]|uniref:Ca-activated chloride channel family protein n=1 Tax=Labrys wisconsinensis TaxID=425677 RepID=A0ABU0JD98_9HYPH|nr:VWA domain-containing protein [Labrys wisconsinensis]MDQ0472253.1 Ca-activated chloride channel family protein [Labrys wisconsinensis]
MPVFATPLAFLALPLPLLVALALRRGPAAMAALRVPAALAGTGDDAARVRADAPGRVLAALAWLALVVAMAGPQTLMPNAALPMSGRTIMLVLDFSGSMETRDFTLDGQPIRRIDAVKSVAAEFLRRRAGDRVGLVPFAEEAQLAAAPTFDLEAVAHALDNIEIGMLGRSTAIGDGLGLALKRLKDAPAPGRAVVLLSDGANTAGAVSAHAAADLARALGIRVHTIALGTDTGGAVAGDGSDAVDEATLADIARTSGGETFRVRTTEDLRTVTAAIDRLEAGDMPAAAVTVARELWPWPAALALLLCLAGFALQAGMPRLSIVLIGGRTR